MVRVAMGGRRLVVVGLAGEELVRSSLPAAKNRWAQGAISLKPERSDVGGDAVGGEGLREQVVATIEVAGEDGQGGVGVGNALAVVGGRGVAEQAEGEGCLHAHDALFVVTDEQKAHHRVVEEPRVQVVEDDSDGAFVDEVVEGRAHGQGGASGSSRAQVNITSFCLVKALDTTTSRLPTRTVVTWVPS